jgi:leucyl aminopeptidase
MAGGAAVIGALEAIAALKLAVNVVGLIPATENLPGGEAYKPGDILRTLSGKTIEVLNTDAEGRVILADALEYAKRYRPALVVDIATLTGAVSVALGNSVAALLGSDPAAVRRVKQAAAAALEQVWELPLLPEYKEYTKSDVADVKNITGRQGGVISGAAFLAAFASPMTWAHLDVGGTAYTTEPKPWMAKGATGWGVHLFEELAKQFAKRK